MLRCTRWPPSWQPQTRSLPPSVIRDLSPDRLNNLLPGNRAEERPNLWLVGRYIQLFSRQQDAPWLAGQQLTSEELDEFNQLEHLLSVDDLLLFRSIGIRMLEAAWVKYNEHQAALKQQQWFGGIFSRRAEAPVIELDEEEEAALRRLVSEYDMGANESNFEQSAVATAMMEQASMTLVAEDGEVILQSSMTGASASIASSQSAIEAVEFAVQELQLQDPQASDPTYQYPVQLRSSEDYYSPDEDEDELAVSPQSQTAALQLRYTTASSKLPELRAQLGFPLQLVCNIALFHRIAQFITIRGPHRSLGLATRARRLGKYSAARLKQLALAKSSVQLHLTVPGVVVCVPASDSTSVVVLDIGRFMLQTMDSTDSDTLEGTTDRYSGHLPSIQLSAAESMDQWEQLRDDDESEIRLLSRLEVKLVFEKRFTLEGELTSRVAITANSFEMHGYKETLARMHHLMSSLLEQDSQELVSMHRVESVEAMESIAGIILARSPGGTPADLQNQQAHQHTEMEISVSVPIISLSLSFSKQEPIVTLLLHGTSMEFSKSLTVQTVKFSIGNILARDMRQKAKEFKMLMTTMQSDHSKAEESPVQIEATLHSPQAIQCLKTGIARIITCRFNELQMEWNHRTIQDIMTLLLITTDSSSQPGSKKTLRAIHSGSTKVEISVSSLSINMNREDEGRHLARFTMENVKVDSTSHGHARSIVGSVGNLEVSDMGSRESVHRVLVGLLDPADSSMLSFEYRRHDKEAEGCEYDNSLDASLSPVRLVYEQSCFMEVVDYVLGNGVLGAVNPVVRAVMAALPSKTRLNIELHNPVVAVPYHVRREEGLMAALEKISISNQFECRDAAMGVEVDALSVQLTQLHLEATGGDLSNHGHIVQYTDWIVRWDRPLGGEQLRRGSTVPDMKVDVVLTSAGVHVDLTEKQYALVCAVWGGNLAQPWVKLVQPAVVPQAEQVQKLAAQIDFRLEIALLTVQLHRAVADQESKLAPLIKLETEEFQFSYLRWALLKEMTVRLKGLMVFDHMQPVEFTKLASTAADSCQAGVDSGGDFVTITKRQVSPLSSEYSGCDSRTEMHFSKLLMEWNHRTVAAVMLFYQYSDFSDRGYEPLPAQGAQVQASAQPVQTSQSETSVHIASLSINMNREDEGRHLARFTMENVKVDSTSHGQARCTVGSVGNLEVSDMGSRESVHRVLVGLLDPADSSMLSFEYRRHDKEAEGCEYDNSLKVKLCPVKILYLHATISELWRYALGYGFLGSINVSVGDVIAKLPSKTLMSIILSNPTIAVPSGRDQTHALNICLGQLSVDNNFLSQSVEAEGGTQSVDLEHMTVQFINQKLYTTSGDLCNQDSFLLEDTDTCISITRCLSQNSFDLPWQKIDANLTKIHLKCSSSDLALFKAILTSNFGEAALSLNSKLAEDAPRAVVNESSALGQNAESALPPKEDIETAVLLHAGTVEVLLLGDTEQVKPLVSMKLRENRVEFNKRASSSSVELTGEAICISLPEDPSTQVTSAVNVEFYKPEATCILIGGETRFASFLLQKVNASLTKAQEETPSMRLGPWGFGAELTRKRCGGYHAMFRSVDSLMLVVCGDDHNLFQLIPWQQRALQTIHSNLLEVLDPVSSTTQPVVLGTEADEIEQMYSPSVSPASCGQDQHANDDAAPGEDARENFVWVMDNEDGSTPILQRCRSRREPEGSRSGEESKQGNKRTLSLDVFFCAITIFLEQKRFGSVQPVLKMEFSELLIEGLHAPEKEWVVQTSLISRIGFFGPCLPGSAILGWQPAIEELCVNVQWQGNKDQCKRLLVHVPHFVTITMSPELVETLRCLPVKNLPPQGDVLITNTLPCELYVQTLTMQSEEGRSAFTVERDHHLGAMRQAKICTAAQKNTKHIRLQVNDWQLSGSFAASATGSICVACLDCSSQQHYLWIDAVPTSSNMGDAGVELTVYCKYAVVNCTGLHLALRLVEDSMSDAAGEEAVPETTTLSVENRCAEFNILLLEEAAYEDRDAMSTVNLAAGSDAALLPAGIALIAIATSHESENLSGQGHISLRSAWSYGAIQLHRDNDSKDIVATIDYEIRRQSTEWQLVFQTRQPDAEIQTEQATDIIYEHQRRSTPLSNYSSSSLEVTDPAPYTDQKGKPMHPKHVHLPSAVWAWATASWQTQPIRDGDSHGWRYASSFDSGWQKESGMFTFVRRRRLVRKRSRELSQNIIPAKPRTCSGVTFDRGSQFKSSSPVFFSECTDNALHWLEICCVPSQDDDEDSLSCVGPRSKVLISDGGVQKKSFELVGNPSVVSDAPIHELCYACQESVGDSRMHVIHIVPSLVVVNRMPSSILVRQEDAPTVLQILPNERKPLWWYASSPSRDVSVHIDDGNHTVWTAPFSVTGAESRLLQCRDDVGELDIFQACIIDSLSNVVIICEEPCPPLRIMNQSSYSLAVGESRGTGNRFEASMPDALPPLSQLNYVLSPSFSHLVIALAGHAQLHAPHTSIKLGNKPGHGSIEIRDADNELVAYLDLESRFVGPQTVIIIRHRMAGATPGPASGSQSQRQVYEAAINVPGIGISLIDTTTRCEVLHACLSGIRMWSTQWVPLNSKCRTSLSNVLMCTLGFDLQDSRGYRTTRFTVDSLQVDSQLRSTVFPTVVSRCEHSVVPWLQIVLRQRLGRFGGKHRIKYFPAINIQAQPMQLRIEALLLDALLGTGSAWQRAFAPLVDPLAPYDFLVPAADTSQLSSTAPLRIYVDSFMIAPAKIFISFLLNSPLPKVERLVSSPFLRELLAANNVWSMSAFPVNLRGCHVQRELLRVDELMAQLASVARADVMENLAGKSIAAALRIPMDAVYSEQEEVSIENPEMAVAGVVAGVGGGVKSVVQKGAGAISRGGNLVGNALASLAFDGISLREREQDRDKWSGVKGGGKDTLESGLASLGKGLFEGVTGVVTQPLMGLVEDGPKGLVEGIGRGAAGLIAKPLVGAADALSGIAGDAAEAAEGIELIGNSTRTQEILRVRRQREVPEDTPVKALFEINWQLTALAVEVPFPDAEQFDGVSPCPRKWHSIPIEGQPSTLPIVEVVVVSVGEPRGEFSMLWDRHVMQATVLESAVSNAKPLAIGLRCSVAGEPAVTGLMLIRHSQLLKSSKLPSGFTPIETTPGGLPAVFLAMDSAGAYDAAVLCVRREVGAPIIDIQAFHQDADGKPCTHSRLSQSLSQERDHLSLVCSHTRSAINLGFWQHEYLFDRRKLGFLPYKLARESSLLSRAARLAPITQILVLDLAQDNVDLAELQRARFVICDRTPSGRFANLNAGAGGRSLYLCFRRGFGEPITHLAVIHALQESPPTGQGWNACMNLNGDLANLNSGNNSTHLQLHYRVGYSDYPPLVDLCVIHSDGHATLGRSQERCEAVPSNFEIIRHTPTNRSANCNVGTEGDSMFICYKRSALTRSRS